MQNVTEKQLQAWKDRIENYKKTYAGMYPGNKPSEKLIQSFCQIYGIPWPLPSIEQPKDEPEEEWDFLK